MLHVLVDADACPVKDEIYRVATRYGLRVTLVSNSWMRTPESDRVALVVVDKGANVADDWIAEKAEAGDIVVTGDILLAARCIDAGAEVIGLKGRMFTPENVGDALATRDLLADLRDAGTRTRGPAPLEKKDRSRFLQAMDAAVQRIKRERPGG
jgi:uncharacterized protein YaiI (UPF0178 family)